MPFVYNVSANMTTSATPEADRYPNTKRFPVESLQTLVAIADAFVPGIDAPPEPTLPSSPRLSDLMDDADSSVMTNKVEAYRRFWSHDLATSPSYIEAVCTAILQKLPSDVRTNLLRLLRVMSNPLGCSALLCYPCASSFASWSLEDRVWALQRLRDSPLGKHREAFCGLKRLLCGLAFSYVPVGNEEDHDKSTGGEDEAAMPKSKQPWKLNPYWEYMSYCGPIQSSLSPNRDAELIRRGMPYDFAVEGAILDVADILDGAQGDSVPDLTYDVVIIGSGCGGGVAAATLANAGYSVLVLEKGPYVSPFDMSNIESEMFGQLYEQSSLLTTEDGNVMILAGSGFGGGSAINWGCCIETPDEVRREWADAHGLEHFRPVGGGVQTEFDASMVSIKERIGVIESPSWDGVNGDTMGKKNTPTMIQHNGMNKVLVSGCEQMGYDYKVTGQNYRETAADVAGFTCFGDRYGNKQSGLVTYLADACEAGTKILPNCFVTKVLKEKDKKCGRFKATGVMASVEGRTIRVNANKCVICSAGSLNTPCLLLKSGFKNRHIGRHLHLHPVTCAVGIIPQKGDEKINNGGVTGDAGEGVMSMISRSLSPSRKDAANVPTRPSHLDGSVLGWLGAPMTAVCNQFTQGPENDGYGARLECPSSHTGLMGAGLSWTTPSLFKETLAIARNSAVVIVLQRDHTEGTVRPDKNGRPKISYVLEDRDKRSMLQSLCGAMSVLAKAGAVYLRSCHDDDEGINLEHVKAEDKEAVVQKYNDSITYRSMPKYTMSVFSAHQMGTCRLGSSPSTSAADEDGELWDCDDLYIADASTLPTASGANPMLTTLAVAHMIANRIALRLQYEDDRIDLADEVDMFYAIQLAARRDDRRARANSLVECVLNFVFSRGSAYFIATVAMAAVLQAWKDGNFFLI